MPLSDEQIAAIARMEFADADEFHILRSQTEAERLKVAHGMWRYARDMLRNLLRAEHPDWTDDEVNIEAGRRLASGRD